MADFPANDEAFWTETPANSTTEAAGNSTTEAPGNFTIQALDEYLVLLNAFTIMCCMLVIVLLITCVLYCIDRWYEKNVYEAQFDDDRAGPDGNQTGNEDNQFGPEDDMLGPENNQFGLEDLN